MHGDGLGVGGRGPLALLLAATLAVPAIATAEFAATVVVAESGFEPAEIAVPAGERIRLDVTNRTARAIEFESEALNREKVVAPGATVQVYVSALAAGRYEFVDETTPARRGALVAK